MHAAPLFNTALRMARKARSLNSIEKATIDLGAGYLVSYERVQSFDSATDSDDPASAVPPIRLTGPVASTMELTDVARLVNAQSPTKKALWPVCETGEHDVAHYSSRCPKRLQAVASP